MRTIKENTGIFENFVCFVYGGAGAGPLHRLWLRNTFYNSMLLGALTGFFRDLLLFIQCVDMSLLSLKSSVVNPDPELYNFLRCLKYR